MTVVNDAVAEKTGRGARQIETIPLS